MLHRLINISSFLSLMLVEREVRDDLRGFNGTLLERINLGERERHEFTLNCFNRSQHESHSELLMILFASSLPFNPHHIIYFLIYFLTSFPIIFNPILFTLNRPLSVGLIRICLDWKSNAVVNKGERGQSLQLVLLLISSEAQWISI